MKTLTFLVILMSLSFILPNKYSTYCNIRFGFCILYPGNFKKEPEPGDQDGRGFISPDKKAEIKTWGEVLQGNNSQMDKIKWHFKIDTGGIKVTYMVLHPTWFIFSGIDTSGNIVYQKTVKRKVHYWADKNLTYVYLTLRIEYPPNQNSIYKSYCDTIANSLTEEDILVPDN